MASASSCNLPSVEVVMLFVPRPYCSFPVVSPVTYGHWLREEQGIVWKLSLTG